MPIAIVIVNPYEPEGEVAARLMELATDKDYDVAVVVAQRGEHNAALSFQVPQDVADAFNADRAERWPDKPPVQPVVKPVDDDADPNTPPVRKSRTDK